MEHLLGKRFGFYGVDGGCFKLGRKVYEATEDENDGYRSYLDSIEIVSNDGIFFNKPLAYVEVKHVDDNYFDGYMLEDTKDGHIWLKVGTDYTDDWYPFFVFDYQPKK